MTSEEKEILRHLVEGVFMETKGAFTPEMVENALNRIDEMSNDHSGHFYSYQHPDYGKMVKPVPEVLQPLLSTDDVPDDLPQTEDIIDSCSSIERSTLAEAVGSIICFWLDRWHRGFNDEAMDDFWLFPLQLAVVIAERYGLRECLPVLLETERQDAEFAEICFADCNMVGLVPACIYNIITEEDLPVMADFVRERGLCTFCKAEVIAAVGTLPRRLPESLPAVQKWLCELLEIFADGIDPAIGDALLLEAIVNCCIHTRCEAAKQTIIRFYSKYKMPNILVPGGINEVRKNIKKASIGVLSEELESAEKIFMYYGNIDDTYCNEDADDDFDDEEEYDDEELAEYYDDAELAPRQEYCGHAFGGKAIHLPVKSLKKYTLRIELEESDPLVWRELEVPSSLCLTSLAQAILLAMGWDEDHLHQFILEGKKRTYYATSVHESDMPFQQGFKDGSRYGVSHLLKTPGDSVTFEYDYGDSWLHAVTLSDVTEYADDEPKKIVLTSGAYACPPDDCGGIFRYRFLMERIQKKSKSADLYDFYEWMGCKWDPEYFPLEQAAKAVARLN